MCSICHGTGLLPFTKHGVAIPHAFVDCTCKKNEQGSFREKRPEDFDFPCSDTFRGFSFEQCGLPDPGYTPEASAFERVEQASTRNVDDQRLDHLQGQLVALRDTLGDHIKVKKKKKYAGYKGKHQ